MKQTAANKGKVVGFYQADAGDAGVVGDVGDVEDLAFVVAAGLGTCGGQEEGEMKAEVGSGAESENCHASGPRQVATGSC